MSAPLGMPEGSVRSLLAIGTLGSAVYMWVTGEPMSEFQELTTGGVMTFYFASRLWEARGQEPPPPPIEPMRDLLDEARHREA